MTDALSTALEPNLERSNPDRRSIQWPVRPCGPPYDDRKEQSLARVLHLFNILGASTESMWLEYTTRLARRGHEVVCGYETLGESGQATRLAKVQLPRINVEPTDNVSSQFAAFAESYTSTSSECLLNGSFDLVHGHGGTRILQGALWLCSGVPMVVSLYGYDCSRLLSDPCWVERYQWSAERGAVFVVLHESMRENLIDHGVSDSSIRVISLGICVEDWPYESRATHYSTQPRFVFVGRLVPKKSPIVLLRAVAALRDRWGIHARLDIAGDGPLRSEVESAIDQFDLSLDVSLHGALSSEQVKSLLRSATCLVLPSTRAPDGDCEGTPIVLMEAQALGVPCITTNHAGNADVLAPSMRSFVIDRADPELLAIAMANLVRLSPVEMRSLCEAGRIWVESQFNIARTATAYDDLYNDLATLQPVI